ncbi:MAG: GDP-mannose 4,6-dehydratase [Candidatus Competibacteraceae bacterium]|nr:GDP-mannose 4,6-dehydratase [Candidatus Competibacteraceae bacterium]
MASPSSTVLITGARGFTGRHLRQRLRAAGCRVVGLVREPGSDSDEISADLARPEPLRAALEAVRPDCIVHLAAITFVPHGDPLEIYQTNLFGTLNLLDAILAVGLTPRKVLIASSANVYGNPPVEVIDETICPAPVNHYATSKLAMEHLARTYQDRLPILIARPFNYTGPGQDERFLIPKIVGCYRRRQPFIELGNLDVIRDFSDVRFVVEAYRRLLEGDAVGETVNICSGVGVALGEILERMNRIAGYAIEVRVNPAFVRGNEVHRLIGDNHKLRRLVGELPAYSLDAILESVYRSV